MTYGETLAYLYQRLPIFQRQGKAALKPDLGNTLSLLKSLDHPEKKFKSVHVAGTNGKGTSCHALASVLQAAGYRTGLYTSPHLREFTERVKINGREIDPDFVVDFVNEIRRDIEQINPSFFEVTVAMAFSWFAQQKVDIAIIETGLGGRLDSTNVIIPEVSLITNISYDHQDLLGETLPEIAMEKAGIIKPGVPVVIGSYQPEILQVFREKAESEASRLNVNAFDYEIEAAIWNGGDRTLRINKDNVTTELNTDVCSDYFVHNVPGVLQVLEELKKLGFGITEESIQEGFTNIITSTGLKGRMQMISEEPTVIADVSHNPDGLRSLFRQVAQLGKQNLHLIFGTVQNKPLQPLFDEFPTSENVYFVSSSVPRSLNSGELTKAAETSGINGKDLKDVNSAIAEARANAGKSDLIVITGSTFVIAEIDGL